MLLLQMMLLLFWQWQCPPLGVARALEKALDAPIQFVKGDVCGYGNSVFALFFKRLNILGMGVRGRDKE
jgi:hypothetical protein